MPFTRAMIGTFDVDLAHEFFQGFVNHALVTLHVDNLRGDNAHHQCETVFKAFARALRMAVRATRGPARSVDQGHALSRAQVSGSGQIRISKPLRWAAFRFLILIPDPDPDT